MTAAPPPTIAHLPRGSTVIAAFSTIVEWYDFTLYLYFATILSRVFFGGGSGSLLTTLAGFAIAYLMRPLGAVAFGHISDRYGRRRMMLLSVALAPASLETWGWRIPFLFGALLAGSVWIARSAMHESPEFLRQQDAGTVPERPLRHSLATQRLGILRAFAISALGSITYYVGITYVPSFLTSVGALSEHDSLWISTGAAVVVILETPVTGLLTDRWGRKPVLLLLCAASALLPITLFSLMSGGNRLEALAGAILLAALAGAYSSVGAVATAEQFRGAGRLPGLALGATGATAIFGGLTPWGSQLLVARTGADYAPGAMIALVALLVLPVLATLRETAPALRGTTRLRIESSP